MLTYIKNSRYQVMVMILGVLAAVSLACRFSQQPEPPLMTPPGAPTVSIVTPTIEEIFIQPESENVAVEEEPEGIEPGVELTPEPAATLEEPEVTQISAEEIIQVDQNPESTYYRAGDVLSLENQLITVLGWEILPEEVFFKSDPGYKYVAVDMVLVNTNTEPILISSFLQIDLIALVDGVHQDYSVSILAQTSIKSNMIDDELLPGERLRAKVGFAIAENATDLLLKYVPEFYFSEPVLITLESEPGLLNPPAILPGELEPEIHTLGGSVETNNLTITVHTVGELAGQKFFEPAEGYRFISVDLTLTNNASAAVEISSDNFNVRDSDGLRYGLDITAIALAGGDLPDGELAPGESVQFVLGYLVPEDESALQFLVDAIEWGAGRITFALPLE